MEITTGKAHSEYVDVTELGVELPDRPCLFVKLENWDLLEDFATAQPADIYWGHEGRFAHKLAAGGNSELLPVANTNTIIARTKAGQTARLYFTWFK